ncbi:MAG: phage holin family protein [Nitrospiraceae bacterium]|nr:phage holin family protein [Nitrospiraceae bacterium]
MVLLLKIAMSAVSLAVAVNIVEGITFTGRWWMMLVVAVIFGLVNTIIKPLVKLFTFPFLILTLGLFTLVINALMLELTAYFSDFFDLGLRIQGFWPAFKGAIIVSFLNIFLHWATGLER